jgi:tetratricopeptide (TPR) repeat protein
VGGDDPGILGNAALALAYFGEDIGAMMALVDRALALNPNYARGWHISGVLRMNAGQLDIAIEHEKTSLRLSPRARVGVSLSVMGAARFLSRRFDEAVPKLLLAIQEDPSHPQACRYLAACYAHMGRPDDAREIVGRVRAITPSWSRTPASCGTPSTASFFCRVCAWRWARRHEPDPPPRRDPCRRCRRVFATTGDGMLVKILRVSSMRRPCAVEMQQATPEPEQWAGRTMNEGGSTLYPGAIQRFSRHMLKQPAGSWITRTS